jgi:hypothetical protein
MHEELKSGLNSGNAGYCLVENLCSCNLLSKNTKIKVYRNVTLPVVDVGWNFVSYVERVKGVWEQGTEENVSV